MNQSTLASAFAAAQPRRQVTGAVVEPVALDAQALLTPAFAAAQPCRQDSRTVVEATALDAQALLNAVRRSLQSCHDTSTYRMLLLNLANTAEAAESNQRRFVS
jgi:hypothetical protein